MSRDEKLRANQRTLAARRRAKRMADAKKKKESAPKTESKPKTRTNTSVAFDKKNDFGALLKDKKPKTKTTSTPTTSSSSSSSGGTSKPKSSSGGGSGSGSPSPRGNGTTGRSLPSNPQLKSQRGKGGTYGRSMPSNPAVGYSKPVRKNFKTQAAFLKALEVYMRRKNRGTDAANSVKKKTTKVMDGRQYGG